MNPEVLKLRTEVASLKGYIQGATAWQRERVWRRALLEKLMLMEGYSPLDAALVSMGNATIKMKKKPRNEMGVSTTS